MSKKTARPTLRIVFDATHDATDDLFPDVTPVREGVRCVLCQTTASPAHPAHAVCRGCAGAPRATAERLAIPLLLVERRQHDALTEEREAGAALSADEVDRWLRYAAAKDAPPTEHDEGTRRRLAVTQAAYADTGNAAISPALRRYDAAVTRLKIAQQALLAANYRRNAALSTLAACLDDMGQTADAALVLRGSEVQA